jgi:hypothetical protein
MSKVDDLFVDGTDGDEYIGVRMALFLRTDRETSSA